LSLLGIGTDIVAVDRIADLLDRHGQRFLDRCFRNQGVFSEDPQTARSGQADPAWVAGRWAAKEAFLKALGKNVKGIPYREIEVAPLLPCSGGLILHGRALEAMTLAGGRRIHLTISHDDNFALASVLIEK
jgi:holo-[acyl-carrier protein] synthase